MGCKPFVAVAALMWLAGLARADDAETVVIHAVGDVAWADDMAAIARIDEAQGELLALVEPIFAKGDLNFANLECAVTEGRPAVDKTYPLICHPKRLAYALAGRLNLLSLANNHSLDAGQQGLAETLAHLQAAREAGHRLWWAGTGATPEEANRPLELQVPGKRARVALFAVANGGPEAPVGSLHRPALLDDVAAAAKRSDIVLVSVHHGPEYEHVPYPGTVDKYHALIDAGADAVIAHHPHVVQGVERYGDGIIFYSLGNFSFGSLTRRHLETGARLYSMIARMTFRGGALAEVEIVPVYANNSHAWSLGDQTLDNRFGTPQPLTGAFATYMIDELAQFSADVPGAQPTALHQVGDRAFVDLGHGAPALARHARLYHEQRHEYQACVDRGAVPRDATDQEMQWENRGGTPVRAERPARKPRGRAARAHRAKPRKAASRADSRATSRPKAKARDRR